MRGARECVRQRERGRDGTRLGTIWRLGISAVPTGVVVRTRGWHCFRSTAPVEPDLHTPLPLCSVQQGKQSPHMPEHDPSVCVSRGVGDAAPCGRAGGGAASPPRCTATKPSQQWESVRGHAARAATRWHGSWRGRRSSDLASVRQLQRWRHRDLSRGRTVFDCFASEPGRQ